MSFNGLFIRLKEMKIGDCIMPLRKKPKKGEKVRLLTQMTPLFSHFAYRVCRFVSSLSILEPYLNIDVNNCKPMSMSVMGGI